MGACPLLGQSDTQAIAEYFAGKVVWVTGASSGLGEALCVALCTAAKPQGLILSARREAELDRVRRHCTELCPGLQAHALPLDLAAGSEAMEEAAQRAVSFCGRVDVLVNNGGVGFRGLVADTAVATDRMVMEVDFFSGVALVKALLPAWLAAQSGHVVQIASVQGYFGLPSRSAYAAAKHAALGFYDALRAEVADEGIAVTTVAPGYISTGHSVNAVAADGRRYGKLDDTTKKGVAPEVLAPQVLAAAARRKSEFVSAPLDAQVARLLRTLAPEAFFELMRRRARKEQAQAEKAA